VPDSIGQLSRFQTSAWGELISRAKIRWISAGSAALANAVLAVLIVALPASLLAGETSWLGQNQSNLLMALSAWLVVSLIADIFALYRCLPGRNDRLVLRLRRWVREQVDPLEDELKALSDEELRARSDDLRRRVRELIAPMDQWWNRLSLEEKAEEYYRKEYRSRMSALLQEADARGLLAEAFALVRDAARRVGLTGKPIPAIYGPGEFVYMGGRHFECQVIGGRILNDGKIAEMKTGEGKTIVCYLGAYMHVLAGRKVHVVTVNDYLVRRDASIAAAVFKLLGVTVGCIQAEMGTWGPEAEERRRAYECDITYGMNSEFGFDYLRDNMKMSLEDQVQGRLDYAIVDEVDSVLIDEARTPLIISGAARDDPMQYKVMDQVARKLIHLQKQAQNETAARLRAWGDHPPEEYAKQQKFEQAVKKFQADPDWLDQEEGEAIGHRHYYKVEKDRKSAGLLDEGEIVVQNELGLGSLSDVSNTHVRHLVENAIRAHVVYQRDKDYVVSPSREIIIVDEFTGRLQYGRQWSEGLHQAIEAKEGVPVKEQTQTVATVTIQNYFKLYLELAGMTGTAMTESEEFMKIYRLEVTAVPTNRPVNRVDHNDRIYRTVDAKYEAIVEEINEMHRRGRPHEPFLLAEVLTRLRDLRLVDGEAREKIDAALKAWDKGEGTDEKLAPAYDEVMGPLAKGRPILVGTTSVENSEKLSALLTRTYGIEHEVLNAKNHAREAEIVAKAGHRHLPTRGKSRELLGNVTIATNMAGRGTDIKLEAGVVNPDCIGRLEFDEKGYERIVGKQTEDERRATKCCIHCDEYDPRTNCAHCFKPSVDDRFPRLGRFICGLNPPCGLHIVGTERHEARRIDNQLRGRSGRQGDPGSSRFFLSLQDDLMRMFMGEKMIALLERLGMSGGMALEDKHVSKAIQRAQKKVEERNFGIRKQLLEYDEVWDYQRRDFYKRRQRVLQGDRLDDLIWKMIDDTIDQAVSTFLDPDYRQQAVAQWAQRQLSIPIEARQIEVEDPKVAAETILEQAREEARNTISRSVGEYVDPDVEPGEWDLRGLSKWAARYGANISENKLKKMQPDEIQEAILAAAVEQIGKTDLSALEPLLSPQYPLWRLAEWARTQFGVEVPPEHMSATDPEATKAALRDQVRQVYHRREITYPVEELLDSTFGPNAGVDGAYAADRIVRWVNGKFNVGWKIEDVQGKHPRELYETLVALNREYLENGRLGQEIDRAIAEHQGPDLVTWARRRFGDLVPSHDDLAHMGNGNVREALLRIGRSLLRYELTRLEQVVLVTALDDEWKDHMYEMDLLKSAIGLRGYAEKDPKVEYKREGMRMYNEMMDRLRERVTQTIFRARLGGSVSSVYQYERISTRHDEATNIGFSADQAAALGPQGEASKPVTFRREQPKVGRNDPCPCGSGKKYKKCCGAKAKAE
jgi:preprotein translocase subunit SecA